MRSDDKKTAIMAYKERKTVAGIYAVRCRVSGRVWVGQSPNLDTVQNRIWFTLRFASNPNRDMQAAWRDHGAESFTFEIVERLAQDISPHGRKSHLKARVAYWRLALDAAIV
ncbi:GIY-YIG nuclease family protein [Varunaivibrio sulfuroxidans]|uniref:GIY-YIG nuclease family protein n=1 Tax=Varunaivibrio sulfuroxidans TaxID=1773489 RepID=A0A4R3JBE8_9PROT|nr:GIY-YIG nuclease family protein [Varunaivibrio sulfuroxidans]TCS62615.1 hypothetical protein EDD55_105162 [Varunaivibrio sulfuroxidans]WES30717.1 GIY-YIG nuclease family protein [Varunaivibrio sulfuroxidans]